MYLGRRLGNDNYEILDTLDMVKEILDKNTVSQLLFQGVSIFGLSEFMLEYNTPLSVLIRLNDSDGTIIDFNGFYCEVISDSYDEYFWQIIDFATCPEFQDFNLFSDVVSFVRQINTSIKLDNLLKPLDCGYIAYDCNDEYLMLRDISTGNVYTCDFFICLSIYMLENKSIQGLSYIDCNSIKYNDMVLLFSNALYKYWSYSLNMEPSDDLLMSETDYLDRYDKISLYYNQNNKTIRYFEDTFFPVLNLKNALRVANCKLLDITPITKGEVASFKNATLTFEDDSSLYGYEYIATKYNIVGSKVEVKEDIKKKLLGIAAKNAIMQKTDYIEDSLKNSISIDEGCSYYSMLPPLHAGSMKPAQGHSSFHTSFGDIDIKNCINIDKLYEVEREERLSYSVFDVIWLLRVTHTGSCWYDMTRHEVQWGTMTEYNKYAGLHGKTWQSMIAYAMEKGITFYHDCILPLCVSKIRIDDSSVDIRITCLTRDYKSLKRNKWGTTCLNVIELPIIFCEGKFVEYEDCYAYYCAFQTIYFSKSLIHNLYGELDIDIIDSPWKNIGASKKANSLYDFCKKDMNNMFKEVYNSELSDF